MSPDEAVNAAYSGNVVSCTKEEYPAIRNALQKAAGRMIDGGHDMRASIMLNEVKRLDARFHVGGEPTQEGR